MQLTVQQPDLSQMFGQDSLFSTLYGMQRQDQATANNNQNLGQAQQDQAFQADMHPLDMAATAANTGHTQALTANANAQNPGLIAASNTATRNDADAASVPADARRQALISKVAAGTSEDDLKQHVARATIDLTANLPNGMPDIAKRRDAQLVISTAPEIVNELRKVKAQGDNSARVAGIEAGSREKIEKMAEDAGKYNKNSTESLLMKMEGGNFQQQAGAATIRGNIIAQEIANTQDPDRKAELTQLLAAQKQKHDEAVLNDYRAKQAAGTAANAGKLNVAPIVGGQNVVDVNTLPAPPVNPNQPVQDQSPTKVPPKAGSSVTHGGKTYRFKGGDPSNQSNWELQ